LAFVAGYWLLVTGYWLLVAGYWLLGVGIQILDPKSSILCIRLLSVFDLVYPAEKIDF
jgi:hypothetical protein